jgi:alpha-aminoadipic semialdehyde synthase
MSSLLKAGAVAHPTLEPAHVVMGIKEPELAEAQRLKGSVGLKSIHGETEVERTWMMFSHTTKGQVYNMPLLAEFLAEEGGGSARLIDWEGLVDQDGKRTVGFGWFAGGIVSGICRMPMFL